MGWYRAHKRDFDTLRERLWTDHADARTVSLPDLQTVHQFFSLDDAWHCVTNDHEFAITRRPIALANLLATLT